MENKFRGLFIGLYQIVSGIGEGVDLGSMGLTTRDKVTLHRENRDEKFKLNRVSQYPKFL